MKIYSILLLLLISLYVKGQESIAILGKVIDGTNGKPVLGVTVTLKKNTISTLTDKDGNFMLAPTVVGNDTLYISDMRYYPAEQAIFVGQLQNVTFRLTPNIHILEEVQINTGYQKLDRKTTTGSVETIGSERLRYGISGGLLDRIEGGISGGYLDRTGYSFNGGVQQPKLTVRGQSSFVGETSPLIVVDNFPFEGSLENINPEDIEDITVLKDAAASSIWGVRAGNGVLVITTKKGKLNQPLTVDISSNFTHSRKPDLFSEQISSSGDFIAMERFLFEKGFYDSQATDRKKPVLTPVVHLLLKHRQREISDVELEDQLANFSGKDVRTDFLNEVYRNAIESGSSLGIRGGSDRAAYSLSLGYNKNIYSMPTNAQDRFSLRLGQTYIPIPKLTISSDLSYVRGNGTSYNNSNRLGYGQILVNNKKLYPYAQLKDAYGNNSVMYTDYDQSFIEEYQPLVSRSWSQVPLDELKNPGSSSESQQVIAGLNVDYGIAEGIRISVQSQLNRTTTGSSSLYSGKSYYMRNIYNRFTSIDNAGTTYGIPEGGVLDEDNSRLWGYALRTQVDMQKQFFGNHSIQALVGAEIREANSANSSNRTYGVYEDRNSFSLVDYTNTYSLFPAIGGSAYIPNGLGRGRTANRFVSLYSNLSYSMSDRYFLSLSARNDASNIFGVETRDKWSPLWSMGAGWEISKERFYKLDFLSYLKVRSSFGYSGNVDASIPAELVIQNADYMDFYSNLPFADVVSLQNPSLRWEKVQMFNMALDWKMLSDRLDFTFDYYRKRSMDLIGYSLVDPTLGVSTVTMNSSELKGRGFDFTVGGRFHKNDWSWNGTLRAGYNRTVLERYNGRVPSVTSQAISAGYFEGKDRYVLSSFRWDGLTAEDGAPRGYENGEPSTNYMNILRDTDLDDLVYHGSSVPRTTISFRNRFGYRNMELAFTVLGQFAYYFRKNSIDYASFFNNWEGHADVSKRWQHPGDEERTSIPSMYYPLDTGRDTFYSMSEVLVRRGDHIRLQDVRLSYRLVPKEKRSFRSVEVFVLGTNLGLLWTFNDEGVDPVYNGTIAPALSLAGGFKVGF